MQNEGRKIMHLPELRVSCTCVRVPVGAAATPSLCSLHFDDPISVEEARRKPLPLRPAAVWWTTWTQQAVPHASGYLRPGHRVRGPHSSAT